MKNILWGKSTAFTRSAITQQQFEREPKFCFCFGPVNNTISPISRQKKLHFNITTSIGEAVKTFGTEF